MCPDKNWEVYCQRWRKIKFSCMETSTQCSIRFLNGQFGFVVDVVTNLDGHTCFSIPLKVPLGILKSILSLWNSLHSHPCNSSWIGSNHSLSHSGQVRKGHVIQGTQERHFTRIISGHQKKLHIPSVTKLGGCESKDASSHLAQYSSFCVPKVYVYLEPQMQTYLEIGSLQISLVRSRQKSYWIMVSPKSSE
jgi:hypothetical protein